MLILIVAGGPDKGRTYELLDDKPVTLGREGDPVALSDRKASRQHARLWCEGEHWYIKDLGSRHGTYRNRELVDGRTEVADGDYLQIGKSVFVAAQMPAEHAERLALIGETPAATSTALLAHPIAPMPGRAAMLGNRGGKWVVGGLAAAAALALLANAGLYFASARQNHQVKRQLARLDASARPSRANPAKLDQVLAQLKQQHEQLTTVTQATRQTPEQVNARLDTVLAKLDDQPDLAGQVEALAKNNHQQFAAVRQTLADQAKAGPALADLGRRFFDAAAARDAARQEDTGKVLAAIGQVKTALPEHPDALADMAKANQLLLKTMVAKLEDDRAQRKVLAAIAEVKSALPGDDSDKLDQVLAKLQGSPDRRLSQKQVTAAVTKAIEPLAEVVAGTAGATGPANAKLDQVLAAMQKRQRTDQKLLSLYDTLKSQPKHTQKMLDQALASLRQSGDTQTSHQTQEALKRVLGEIRGRMITDSNRIARMVRHSVAKALDQRLPTSAPGGSLAEADAKAGGDGTETSPASVADASASNDASSTDTAADAETDTDKPLTDREQAYRMAFETGQPVTIGGGHLNPMTGEVSDGKLLDPEAAKAAGIKHWRDWYLMDNMAERMRLQKLAQSYRTRRGSGPPVVRIPSKDGDKSVRQAAIPAPQIDVQVEADDDAR